jgi:hypothetical protein
MEPWSLFHDELAMRPEFMEISRPGTHARFSEMLEAVLSKVIKQPTKLVDPHFFHLPEHRFWHGMARVGNRAVIAFFYESTGQGLAGLMEDLSSQQVMILRMSMVELPGPAVVSTTRGRA